MKLHRAALGWSLALGLALPACRATEGEEAPRQIRIAVCQIEVGAQPEVNLSRVEAALAEAAEQGADLACFPEACVFGWVNPAAHDGAATIPGPVSGRIAVLAERYGLMIALGLAERDGDQLHNAVVLIDRDRRLLLRHRKVNILQELMDPPYTPGTGASESVVDTRFGRIGLLICADTFEAPLVEELAAQAPDLVLVPYGWAAPAEKWPEHGKSLRNWVAHTARTVGAPVVGTDSTGQVHAGPWKGFVLGGQSLVADAGGEIVCVLPDRAPEVRIVELELGAKNTEDGARR